MNRQCSSSLALATAAMVLASSISITAAQFHTFNEPKLKLYSGDETAGVTTYRGAKGFCRSRGRVLASRNEWCHEWWKDDPILPDNIYGGLKDDEQWVPIRGGTNHNHYLQIGHWKGTDATAACKTYKELYNMPEPQNQAQTPQEATIEYCSKPPDCTENTCVFTCPHEEGYYPDPTDCRAYCHCRGHDLPSYWERVEGDGLVWDPYCGGSTPLDETDKPLGGMTGGCPNHQRNLDDPSYCTHDRRDLQVDDQPLWGIEPDKQPWESNYVLCTLLAKSPPLPETCGSLWAADHITTFDGLKFDCQGTGEYILSKSMESDFQLQGRFEKFEAATQITVTTAATLVTGHSGEPTIEVRFNGCKLEYLINGVSKDLDSKWAREGTLSTENFVAHFFLKGDDRIFYFPGSGMSLHIRKKHSDKMGCYMNVKVCLPSSMLKQTIVGLYGSPNGYMGDDFMDRDGISLNHRGNIFWDAAHHYCASNWCIKDPANSLFEIPVLGHYCHEPYDSSLENDVMDVSPDIFAICDGNMECLVEGTAGDISDSVDSLAEQLLLSQHEVFLEEGEDDPDPMDHDRVFEQTEAKAAPELAYTKGDPHFKTFSGERFDFHGGCDLVLLKNQAFHKGAGMDVHIRTKINSWWSYVDAAALRIGSETIEINGGDKERWLWINRKSNSRLLQEKWYRAEISGYSVRYQQIGPSREVQVYLGGDEVIILKSYKDFVRVDLSLKEAKNYQGALGLLGRFPDGSRVGRDRLTLMDDVNAFGQEWQVGMEEPQIFHSYDGVVQAPQRCEIPSAPSIQHRRRRLGESSVSKETAEAACAHLVDPSDTKACVFDVLTTEDLHMADAFQNS